MIPVIAIVGRPNVGKSTLFNCLTQSRDALVADMPGVTRDRQYGRGCVGNQSYVVIDTGGIGGEHIGIEGLTIQQAEQAIAEADVVLFVVDARVGLTPTDQSIAQQLRKRNKTILLVVNKIEGLDSHFALSEFHALGFEKALAISAAHQRGIDDLLAQVMKLFSVPEKIGTIEGKQDVKIAIVGRPNVGKSTLINRILGKERVIVFDMPGTTRDSIHIPFENAGRQYMLIDTAGLRRRGQVTEAVEKISVVKTLQAIEDANVVVFLMDARAGVTEQDLHLLGFIIELGRAFVIAVNKWDGLTNAERSEVKRELDRRLTFIDFAHIQFISAMHGTGVGDLFKHIDRAYRSATKVLPTPLLNKILQKAITAHQPPINHGRRIKLRYAHAGGHNPPVIVIHGNQAKSLPDSYRRFLSSFFRKSLRLVGTPIRIEFKEGENPYQSKNNPLTQSQWRKRQRMIQHRKRSEKK